MRSNYWSSSKLAYWLLQRFCRVQTPTAMTAAEWNQWHATAKAGNKFVYWFVEHFLDDAQRFVCWPIDKLNGARTYLRNRFITKTHVMSTGLKPGEYYEYETRLLHAMFEELVTFIEIEKAWEACIWDQCARDKHNVPWWMRHRLTRIGEWRCPSAGIDYLEWEMSLICDESMGYNPGDSEYGQPTQQAIGAKEQKRLYDWWKNIRPNRPDPYDASGWSQICEQKRAGDLDNVWSMFDHTNESEHTKQKTREALDILRQIEQQYAQEDTEMMIALIRVRSNLWT